MKSASSQFESFQRDHDELTTHQRWLVSTLKNWFKANNAVLVSHYYTAPHIQALAEETGGCVADSLEMARFGANNKASTLIVAGVKFMGETAKILSPEKRVFMPTLEATCSLDINCQAEDFSRFCDDHPGREVVVYANTSAEVKALADWVVTSSIAVKLIEHLHQNNKKILWAPDKHLGNYVKKITKADMEIWDGACIVHEEFKAKALIDLKQIYTEALVLAHPESPDSVLEVADVIGSTSQLIEAATKLDEQTMIVATDQGILYKMRQAAPDKNLIIAPTAGEGATCKSCAHCPWMAMNQLENLHALTQNLSAKNEIVLSEEIRKKAFRPLERMLGFSA